MLRFFSLLIASYVTMFLGFQDLGAGVYAPSEGSLHNLLYYSDYFSFVGRDPQGYVAFAIDNNRGKDGEEYQAEHFVVLHDDQEGWKELLGNGNYENRQKVLTRIPDSSHFRFKGTPEKGLLIVSPTNKLELQLAPVGKRLTRMHDGAMYRMGSSVGTLHWKNREITGRYIYEYLYIPAWNRLTRSYPGLWKDFHGIYAFVEGGGDLYWHTRQDTNMSALTGQSEGFFFLNGKTERLMDLEVQVTRRMQAKGTYRWPAQWLGQWHNGNTSFTITLSDSKVISNWVFGGFSMGIVKGTLRRGNTFLNLYGLGELLI